MNAEREVVDMKVIKNLISKYALMLAVPILLFVVLSIIFHGVIGTNNIPSLMQQAVAPAILGWGVLFNIKVGNWDFSVGSVVLLSAIIGGNIAVRLNWGFAGLLIFCLLVAVLAGVVVGLVYYFLKIPTIITSIGMLLIYESISSYAFEGQGIYLTGWNLLGNTEIVIIAIVAAATAYLIFYRSSIGYYCNCRTFCRFICFHFSGNIRRAKNRKLHGNHGNLFRRDDVCVCRYVNHKKRKSCSGYLLWKPGYAAGEISTYGNWNSQ